ncbi:excalibur calcium-binding domain-containing protein [Pseudoxanthomonas suwonensis]|uniref:excalibur calcium-binding domain-containing protein n=1 Tax=Pseudoxanthomonas suwonensis TaxID=314722 RepID=UPI00193E2A55
MGADRAAARAVGPSPSRRPQQQGLPQRPQERWLPLPPRSAAGAQSASQAQAVRATPAKAAPGSGRTYRNCAEARAAGAAPVRRGEPGYGTHLDRDNDGVGCE